MFVIKIYLKKKKDSILPMQGTLRPTLTDTFEYIYIRKKKIIKKKRKCTIYIITKIQIRLQNVNSLISIKQNFVYEAQK